MAIRKRKQYQIKSYELWDFNEKGELRKEGREINLAENQIVELIQAIKGREYNEDGINPIPELFFLEVGNKIPKEILKEHIKNGLYINNKKYVRLVRSSSMGRNGTISFIEENLYRPMMRLISLDKLDTIDKAVISKLESYLGLAFSTTIFIDAVPQNVCIVDADKFKVAIEDNVKSYKQEVENRQITKETVFSGGYDVDVELFDGQGLHTPEWGRKVAKELGMRRAATGYQIRLLPAFKGMSYEFKFKDFYREKGIEYIEDYTGKKWRVEDLDCVWTTSMFKFSKYFDGWEEVKELREKLYTPFNQNVIGISKWSDDEDNTDKKTAMTYQYLQSLALDGEDLIEMSNYTKDIVERVYRGELGATLAYLGLLQDMNYIDDDGNEVDVLEENMMATKVHYAITKNPNMINDPYIQNFLQRQLERTINDMKLGRIYVDGQYSFIAQDPVLMLEMIAGLEPKGSLKKGEFYSTGTEGYYATFRSPMTHSSEVQKLNFIHNDRTDKWLHRYKNIIVLNGFDLTAQASAGADFDGDTFFWTKDKKIINAVIEEFKDGTPNYPVVDVFEAENRAEAVKEEYTIENIIKYDLRTLDNTIGQITNIATYFTNKGHEDLKEYDKELIISSLMQNEAIDYVKHGIKTITPPESFKKAKKYKPYFLQKYKYHRDKNIQKEMSTPLNINCRDIERWEKELFKQDKVEIADTSNLLIDKELINADVEETRQVSKELIPIYKDFKKDSSKLFLKCKYKNEDERREIYDNFYDTYHYKVLSISDNVELVSSLAVYLNYIKDKTDKQTKSYQFPWAVCWEGLAKTIEKKAPEMIKVPRLLSKEEKEKLKLDDDVFEFRGKYYQMMEMANKISADDFIINQYQRKIEKDLKKQVHNFTLETVLYGYKPLSTNEVVEIIKNEKLRLGSKEYNGKQFAALFKNDEYIASIRDKDEEILDDELGYIDLKSMKNKVDIEIIEKCKSSLKVRLKLAS
ncbi:MAG TPA: hypothetical protein GXX63_02135 [Tissierellia bacterium]|nr:hypothetical protein [Tissierellia bacterium]